MARFLLLRLAGAVPTLLIVCTLSFFLLHAAPGGPFDSDRLLAPAVRSAIEARYHLDEPLPRQYWHFLRQLAHGDLGPSLQYRGITVNRVLADSLPIDIAVGVSAMLIALLLGGAAGIAAAWHRGRPLDRWIMAIAMIGVSTPVFVSGPILVLVFAVKLHWLPAGDWVRGHPTYFILPAVALALPYTAYVARLLRSSVSEVLASPYIRAARAKGLSDWQLLLRHALRPALTPLVSFLGPAFAGVLTGSIVIESLFGLPGIGRYFVLAAMNRDYTMVMGITIVYGAAIIAFNLLADLCYAWIDPRVRLG